MAIDMSVKGQLVAAVVLVGAWAAAQVPVQQPAVTRSALDTQLQWGPCPAFMPKGCGLAVLNGDPAQANADVFLRLPANTTIPEHWHTSAERMVLVAGELAVSYKGQCTRCPHARDVRLRAREASPQRHLRR